MNIIMYFSYTLIINVFKFSRYIYPKIPNDILNNKYTIYSFCAICNENCTILENSWITHLPWSYLQFLDFVLFVLYIVLYFNKSVIYICIHTFPYVSTIIIIHDFDLLWKKSHFIFSIWKWFCYSHHFIIKCKAIRPIWIIPFNHEKL